ncbi:MAG: DUF4419 domain-containing protein [Myxococcota bacterium]
MVKRTTFAVSDVEEAPSRLDALDRDRALRSLLHQPVEAMYSSNAKLVKCDDGNQLARAVHDAFYDHRPLTLSPDTIWFSIASGFANHMSLHAETLRERFVSHDGRLLLTVTRPDFSFGGDNPWPEVLASFSDQIAEHVGKARDLLVCDFSTTGPTQRAASEILLMDAYQAYFEYEVRIGCGIPRIHLLGTEDDWRSVRARARALGEYGLEAWVEVLDPVLEQFVSAARGDVDLSFWRSMFRYESGSGRADLSGWLHTLFPYLKTERGLVWNDLMAKWPDDLAALAKRRENWDLRFGPGLDALPPGLSSAPVRVSDLATGETHDMRFIAGLFGVTEDPEDGALAPEFGWALVHGKGTGKRFSYSEKMREENPELFGE